MSLWDLSQAAAGWRRANGVKDKPRAPSDDAFEQAVGAAALDDD